jgi:peptidyl-prolyl cis-trans isomerase D
MLDLMRRKRQLKLVLWLVIIAMSLTMMIFFIPGVDLGGIATTSSVAEVDGRPIPTRSFVNLYSRTVDRINAGGTNRMDRKTLQSMGLPQQVLEDLVSAELIDILADRLGVRVTPEEVRRAVETHPNLQNQGKFIGIENYKALLAANNYSVADFESELERLRLLDKVHAIVTSSLDVGEREVREEFSRSTLKTQVDFVMLTREEFRKRVSPTAAELEAHFNAHGDSYRVGEKRHARYLLVPAEALAADITVTEEDVLQEWKQMPHEETAEASHILLLVEDPAQEAEIRQRAEELLRQIRAGADFARMAREHSQDTGSAANGGYLGPFQRGQMVPEFEDAAFSLEPGKVSDLVKTQYGFHIIKVLKRETPTLESNRPQLAMVALQKKALALARQKAEEGAALLRDGKKPEEAARELGAGAEVRETGLFTQGDNPFDFGISQAMMDEVFTLKEAGGVGKALEHPLGYAVCILEGIEPARPGRFEEFRNQVTSDYTDARAGELMQAEAQKLAAEARKQGSLREAARGTGFGVRKSQEFTVTGTADPEIGANSPFNRAAFELEPGQVGDPQTVLDNMVVFQVLSRTPFDEAAFAEAKPELKQRMLESLRDPYFQEYVGRLRAELEKAGKLKIYNEILNRAALNY